MKTRDTSAAMTFYGILILGVFHATVASTMSEEEFPLHCNNSVILPIKDAKKFDNGSIYDSESRSIYPKDKYWKDESSGTVYGCPCDLERPCLWKCCPYDQAIDSTSNNCTAHSSNKDWFKPVVNSDDGERNRSVVGHEHFVLFYGDCGEGMTVIPEEEYILRGSDGSMVLKRGDEPLRIEADSFCVDYAVDLNRYVAYQCSPHNVSNYYDIYFSKEKSEVPLSNCRSFIVTGYRIGSSISVIFLILSFVVYACRPELRNLHGKCLMCHNACLLTAFLLQLLLNSDLTMEIRRPAGFFTYFAFLSTSLWLNIMCIDMCIAFSDLKPMSCTAKERDRKKFILYMLYAWGLPLVPLGIVLYMEYGDAPSYLLKPQWNFWFGTWKGEMAYFIGPIATIVAINISLFIFTAVKIFKLKKQTTILTESDSRRHSENKQGFKLYLKLFIVMGANWAFEIIPRIANDAECILKPVSMFIARMQGFFIFLILVWKDEIRRKLIRRLCPIFASSMEKQTEPVISSSDGRSICTASSTVTDGEIKLNFTSDNSSSIPTSLDSEQL